MKVNGKSKTPITAAQAKKNNGESGGTQARTSQQTSKKKLNGVKTAVLDRISDGILAFDAGMNYTYLNERAGELLGRSAEELIGKNLEEEYSVAGRTPFMEACQRALETQSIVWLNEYFPPTGRWLEGRVYPSQDGVSVLFSESTRQKVEEVEDRYRIVVDSMQEFFFLADVLTDEQGRPQDYRFVDVNIAMEKLLGKSRSQIVGQTIRELLPLTPRDIELVKRIAAVGLGSEPFFIDEYSESMQTWFRSHFFSPRPGQAAGMSIDVTASKQAEEKIREISMFPEQNPNPVIRLSRDGEILYANQASASLLAAWKKKGHQAASFRRIKKLLLETLKTGSNQEVEIESQGTVFTCLLVPFPQANYVNLYLRDVTEHKQAEEALRSLINQAGAGITRIDTNGKYVFVNPVFCEMLGYSEAELTGMTIWDVTDEEVLEKNKALFERLLTRGEGYYVEKRMIRRNGSRLWVSVGTSPVQDADGQVRGATAVIVDITRRKRAEESLLDGARRSLFLSSLSDTLRSIDDPWKIKIESACLLGAHLKASRVAYVEINGEGQAYIHDHYVDDVPEMPERFSIYDFIPKDQLSRFQSGRSILTADVQKDSRYSEFQKTALEALSITAQIILPFMKEGQVVGALYIQQAAPRTWKEEEISLVDESADRIRSMAERAQAQENLRESEKRFRILANAVPSIVWTSAPDGRLLYVNDRWYDYIGLQRGQDTPLWSDLRLHPEDAQDFFNQIRSVKSTKAEAVMEVRLQRHDGIYRWFQTRSVPTLDENGHVTAWHGVLTDIHELLEQDAEQRKVIDSTPFMLTRCSRDMRYQFVSRAYAEMLGHTAEEVTGRPIVEIMGEEALNTILPHVKRVLQGERVEYDERIAFKQGISPYLHVTYTPDRDEQGNVVGWFASIVDITERRRMEDALRESEHKFNLIYSKLPFTAALLRPNDGVIVDVNEEFEQVFGFAKQEAIGRTIFEIGIRPQMEDRVRVLSELQANLSVRNMEIELLTGNQGPRSFLINTDVVNISGVQYVLQTAQDITERKRIEQSLERERELFKRLFETMPVMSTIYDPETNTLRMNAEAERVTGWKQEEVTVVSLLEALYPDPDYMKEILGRMAATVTTKEWVDVKIRTRDGRTLDTMWANISLMDNDKIITGISLGIDITELKQAEAALQVSEEKYRRIVETANEGIWEIGPDTRTVFVNARMAEMLGYTVEEMIGRSSFEFVFPEDHLMGETRLERAKQGTVARSSEFKYRRKDGSVLWTLVSTSPQLDEQGNFLGSIAMIMDITERKQAENALRSSEERMRLAIESNRMIAWEWDPEADRVITSDNIVEVYGLSAVKTEAEGFALIWPEDVPAHQEKVSSVMQQGGEYHSEFRITRPVDGRTQWMEERATALTDVAGHVTRLVGVVTDITERKLAEQELAEYARQQEALFHLADRLHRAEGLEGIFDPALDAILSALQCDRASILLFDSQDVMRFVAWRGLSDSYRKATDGHSPWKRGKTNARPIWMDDIESAEGLSDSLRETIRQEGICSLAFIPMISNGNLIGKFMVYFNQLHKFGAAEIEFSQTIAHQIAASVERKRATEELRQSKQRLALTYHHAPIGINETTLDGDFIQINDEFCRMLGYSFDELTRLGIEDVTHPDDLQLDLDLYKKMVAGEIPSYRIEKRYRKKDGSLLWAEVVRSLVCDEDGKALYGIGGVLDIDLRKQKEEELRARTEEIEALMEVSPIGIFVAHDPECIQMTANPAGYHLVEMPEDSTRNVSKSAPEHERPTYRTFRNDVELTADELPMQAAARQAVEIEEETLELRFENGSHKYIYAYAKPLFDSQGKVRGAISSMLDITQRIQNEAALRESEERFSKAFRASPDAVIISRLSDGQILEVNKSWVTLFGYEVEEAAGKSSLDLNLFADPNDRKKVVAILQEQGSVRDFEIDIRQKSGKLRQVLLSVESIEINDVDCLISILHDVTERRMAEEALRRSEERFTRFMHHLPGLAWIKDIEGRYVFANAAAQKAFNASPAELYGKTDWEIFPHEVAGQFNRNDDLAVTEEKGVQMVETLPQPDGVIHHSLVTKFSIPGPDGSPALIGGTAFDITERIQMEEALRVASTRAEQSAYRMTQLQKITAALSQAVTPKQVSEMVVEQGAQVLGAAGSSIFLFNEDTHTLEMLHSSLPETTTRPFTRIPISMQVPACDAIRSSQPVWMESQEEYLRRYPHLAKFIQQWGYQAAVAIPMLYKGRVMGVLSMSFERVRPYSLEDQDYLLTLARQAAQSLERARVEYALRLDATMMENVSAGIYLVRASDGILIHTNPKFDNLFGYAPGEIIGKHVSILNAPAELSPQEMANKVIESLNREGVWQGQILSIRKDGTRFWAFSSVTTFEHPNHGTVWVAARQDISGQKLAEEALRQSEQRYRAIVSQATAGIVRKDSTGGLLFVNQAFCDMLEMSESELTGRRIWELTHPEDASENKRLYDRLVTEGIPFQLEKRLIRKNGSILWVSVSVSPVIDDSGHTNSAVSVYVDVTRRRQAEGRLALLTEVSEMTRRYDEPDELFYAVSRVVGEHFQVRRSLFNEIDLDNDQETVHRDYCRGVDSVAGVHAISDYSSITTAEMMVGKTVVNQDSQLDPRTAQDYERSYVQNGERAYVAVPLLREGTWVASLWISDDKPREWVQEDVYLLEAIAERTWTAAEKLRVDRALRDSEERLRVTFNTTVVGFATLRPNLSFIDVNDAFCHLVGYSREELLELNYAKLTHPKFSEDTRNQLTKLVNGEVPSFTIEKIFIRRDGTEIWVQNSLSIVRDEDGNPYHLIAICQDVTERKRTEEALHQLNLELEERVRRRTVELQAANEFLRESEATSRLILESMPDAIVIVDKDGEIVHANQQVETLFGYTTAEVMGRAVESLVPERFRGPHAQQRLSYADQRSRRIMGLGHDLVGRRKDESEFPVEVMLAPINNSTNWDVLVAIRDNTRQRQAQEALRINEEKLRTLFEILPVGISFLDRDGKVNELNSALSEILDLSKSEILAGKFRSRRYIRADGEPMPITEMASTRARQEQKTIYNVETGIVKENGDIIWTSVNAAPVQVADVEAAVVTIDITERKQAEEALRRHRERLRMLSRRLVEVQEEERHAIARELHDRVGQNLAALTLNLNILRNQLSGEVLEKIGTRLNDSVNLVNDILTITRSVMADLRPNVLDDYGLDAAINEYAERFSQRYGIRVVTHTPAKATPRLDSGVEMTLLRIAQEALTNIAKHAQASQAVMSLEMEEDSILMTIEDNGMGIMSWQKVNQAGSHGLRIMRERAEAFGGYLKVNSTYKNGTKIEVKIPLTGSTSGTGSKEKRS